MLEQYNGVMYARLITATETALQEELGLIIDRDPTVDQPTCTDLLNTFILSSARPEIDGGLWLDHAANLLPSVWRTGRRTILRRMYQRGQTIATTLKLDPDCGYRDMIKVFAQCSSLYDLPSTYSLGKKSFFWLQGQDMEWVRQRVARRKAFLTGKPDDHKEKQFLLWKLGQRHVVRSEEGLLITLQNWIDLGLNRSDLPLDCVHPCNRSETLRLLVQLQNQ